MKAIILSFYLLALVLSSVPMSHADILSEDCLSEISVDDKDKRLWQVNLTGIGIITAWGVANWDYFSGSPKTRSEGWFNNDTASGGADKLGHLYTSYVTAHGLSNLYEYWCFNKNDAALYGAWSSFAIVTYMEIGDSFSSFGFSKEDLLTNTLGEVLGYYLYKYPELSNKIDIRWEYGLDPQISDFTTDYENSKYLLALKLNGFEFSRSSWLKHIELHAGYYTRGFQDTTVEKERNLYLGIGINLTDLFRRHGHHKTSTLLKYFQLPATYIAAEKNLNE